MWLNDLRQRWFGQPPKAKPAPRGQVRRCLRVEALENRVTPASFNAPSVAALIRETVNGNENAVWIRLATKRPCQGEET